MIFHENEKDMPTRPFFDQLPCFLLGSSFLKTPAACIMNQLDDLPENKEDNWLVISKILQPFFFPPRGSKLMGIDGLTATAVSH